MATSSTRGRGDTPKDEAWRLWMADNGGLEVISPEAEDIPFPAKLRWNGDLSMDGSPWTVPPPGRRCNGKAYLRDPDGDYVVDAKNRRIMRPCWNWPMKGMSVCLKHGGGIARVRKGALERLASSLDAVTGELLRLALSARDEKVRHQSIVAIMDRLGIRSGVDIHEMRDPEYLNVLRGLFDKPSESADE